MNKLLWTSVVCLIMVLSGCNNSFTGSKVDMTAKNNALIEKKIQEGSSVVFLNDGNFQVTAAGNNSKIRIGFGYQYDYDSITETNKAVRVFLVTTGATKNDPAGVLQEKTITGISHTEDSVTLYFDAAGDIGVGYAVYVDATKVTFNNGLYYLNSNKNQKQGEETDSYFYSSVLGLNRTQYFDYHELNKFDCSFFSGYSATNTKESFIAGKSTSMIVGEGFIYEPVVETLGNLALKKFDYTDGTWKNVEGVKYSVKTIETPSSRTYSVIAEGFAPAVEMDAYLLYIAQPHNIRFKQYNASSGDKIAAAGAEISLPWRIDGMMGDTIARVLQREAHTKSDYASFSEIFNLNYNNSLTLTYIQSNLQKNYLKITIVAKSDANYNKISAAWADLQSGYTASETEQTVKFFSYREGSQNIALTIDFKSPITEIITAKRHEVYWYPISDGASASDQSASGIPLVYVRNDFKIRRGAADESRYNEWVHPFASPTYAMPQSAVKMPNWTKAW